MTRVMASETEADVLLDAQKDIFTQGNTSIKCPRCGKPLEYKWTESGTSIYCSDSNCIIVTCRGI